MNPELLPQDTKRIAHDYFATEQTSVVHHHKKFGYFPRSDYSMPHRLHGRDIWFSGTATAWHKKYVALIAADDDLREMASDQTRMKEANERRHKHMTAATKVAEARGLELMILLTRDGDNVETVHT